MVKGVKNGQMERNTAEGGMKIKCRAQVNSCMPIKMSMKVNSSQIELMASAATCKSVERRMKVFGLTISLMAKGN